jgi:Derlin-2/3
MMVAIAYTFAQENRGQTIQFFIIPLEVKFLPYVMLFITLVQGGPGMALEEAMAIPAAHLYEFLTVYWPRYGGGRNLLPTPAILERMFEKFQGARQFNAKDHGTAVPATAARSNNTSATSSGVSNPLSFQGRGRRLGGTWVELAERVYRLV